MATDIHLQEWIPSPCCASTTRQGNVPRALSASSRMTSTSAERPPRWTSTATGTHALLLSLLLQLGSSPVSLENLPYLPPPCMHCIIEGSVCCILGRGGPLMAVFPLPDRHAWHALGHGSRSQHAIHHKLASARHWEASDDV